MLDLIQHPRFTADAFQFNTDAEVHFDRCERIRARLISWDAGSVACLKPLTAATSAGRAAPIDPPESRRTSASLSTSSASFFARVTRLLHAVGHRQAALLV